MQNTICLSEYLRNIRLTVNRTQNKILLFFFLLMRFIVFSADVNIVKWYLSLSEWKIDSSRYKRDNRSDQIVKLKSPSASVNGVTINREEKFRRCLIVTACWKLIGDEEVGASSRRARVDVTWGNGVKKMFLRPLVGSFRAPQSLRSVT